MEVGGSGTYDGNDLLLDDGRKRDQFEEQSKVELQKKHQVSELVSKIGSGDGHTEETRRAREMVCWARVMIATWGLTFPGQKWKKKV
jgi:hypothetical protein